MPDQRGPWAEQRQNQWHAPPKKKKTLIQISEKLFIVVKEHLWASLEEQKTQNQHKASTNNSQEIQ